MNSKPSAFLASSASSARLTLADAVEQITRQLNDDLRRDRSITKEQLKTLFNFFRNIMHGSIRDPDASNFRAILHNAQQSTGPFDDTHNDQVVQLPNVRLCQTLEDINSVDERDIDSSIRCLDHIEECALVYYASKPRDHKRQRNYTPEDILKQAFNARLEFYKKFFVAPLAKHTSHIDGLLEACDYLRSNRTLQNLRVAARGANMQTMQDMLSRISASEQYQHPPENTTYSFTDGYQLQNLQGMQELGRALYRAIQGRRMIDELVLEVGQSIQLSQFKSVIVTPDMIGQLSNAALSIEKARLWENRAFTSSLEVPIEDRTHRFELEVSEVLAQIDFDNNPEDIFLRIKQKKEDRSLQKYLKYKNKYLELKKQLNLL